MLGQLVTQAPRRVLAASAVIFILAGVLAAGVLNALSLNRYEAPGSDSVAAREILAEQFDTGSANVVLLVSATAGTVDDAEVVTAGSALTADVATQAGVGDAWSYWSENAPETLRSEDGRHALVLAWVPGDADHVRGEVLPTLERGISSLTGRDRSIDVQLGGADEVFRVTAEQSRTDFVTAETIVIPLVALLLWVVYRRLAPALVTLAIGLFSAVTTLAMLRVVAMFTEISTFAANVGLILGIGLGVDYGLFMVYRFREELQRHSSVTDAVRATVTGAGRTVVFSGATVAASLAVLFVFPFPFLSSFAYGGIAVVVTAVFGATIVLPAALALLGHRADRRRPGTDRETSFWYRLTQAVMRRPIVAGTAALVAVLGLAAPAVGVNFGAPDDRLLPTSQPVRAMYDTIRAGFATEDADALHVVAPSAAQDQIGPYAAELSTIPGVLRVDSAAGAFSAGERTGPPGPDGADRFTDGGDGTWMAVLPTGERLADDPTGLVADVRAAPAPFDVVVGGYPADLTDYRDGVVERLPLVAALVLVVTFVLLFLMTGSVIAPIKASILNLLSLSVMFGALVWGFQNGGLAEVFGFEAMGTIEPSIPILMFCIAHGLSMDYEVFLLARIKEDYDRTGDVVGSVPRGIARSAPLVTAAALILAASFLVYTSSEVVLLQQLGVGAALAIIVDATLIRGVLVPAFMRLAGRWNWWAPGPLRRLHARIGLREDGAGHPAVGDRRPDPVVRATNP